MLSELRLRNFSLVEDASFQLNGGMSVFTGETGAGKSLLLDAITLLLGAKASSNIVRSGAKTAEVEGIFDLSQDATKRRLAHTLGFEMEPEEGWRLLVRREISAEDLGRNRVWIQGRSATRAQLQELLGDWVEISGQHEFLKLNREDYLLSLIDQFGGLRGLVKEFALHFTERQKLRQRLESLSADEQYRQSKVDFLHFQIEELEKAGVGPGLPQEEENLLALRGRLGSLEKIRSACEFAQIQLDGHEAGDGFQPGILNLLQNLSRELRPFQGLDQELGRLCEKIEEAQSVVDEVHGQISQMLLSLAADPEALENAEARLSLLNRLKRKFALDANGLLRLLEQSCGELADLSPAEGRADELKKELSRLEVQLAQDAEKLHEERVRAAGLLQSRWQKDLKELGMKQARISLEMKRSEDFRPSGNTRIETLFSANPGESLKPISRVASGGELSRILLALKHIIAGRSEIGVYLFDEVDAGIGGETAHAVGARLRSIAGENQVLVVTHLAQVAASAHEQFRIEKRFDRGRVRTFIDLLEPKDRLKEIARMLGNTGSKAAQTLARELLKRAEARVN